jgi:hypothetical protein
MKFFTRIIHTVVSKIVFILCDLQSIDGGKGRLRGEGEGNKWITGIYCQYGLNWVSNPQIMWFLTPLRTGI